jgi:hypothetical protein
MSSPISRQAEAHRARSRSGVCGCTYDKLATDPITCIAQAIHRDYFRQQHSSPGRQMPSWEDLAAWERSSNIAAALHINAKLAVLGLRLVPKGSARVSTADLPSVESVPQDLRESIAITEHNRWMAERLLAGWSLGVRAKPENKRRHQFVPWEMLSKSIEQEKDRSQVAVALRVCRELVEGPEARFTIVRV